MKTITSTIALIALTCFAINSDAQITKDIELRRGTTIIASIGKDSILIAADSKIVTFRVDKIFRTVSKEESTECKIRTNDDIIIAGTGFLSGSLPVLFGSLYDFNFLDKLSHADFSQCKTFDSKVRCCATLIESDVRILANSLQGDNSGKPFLVIIIGALDGKVPKLGYIEYFLEPIDNIQYVDLTLSTNRFKSEPILPSIGWTYIKEVVPESNNLLLKSTIETPLDKQGWARYDPSILSSTLSIPSGQNSLISSDISNIFLLNTQQSSVLSNKTSMTTSLTTTFETTLPTIATKSQNIVSNINAFEYPSATSDITSRVNDWSGLRVISTESPNSPKNGLLLSREPISSQWTNSIFTISENNSSTIVSMNDQRIFVGNLTSLTNPSTETGITNTLNTWSGLGIISTKSENSPKDNLILSNETSTWQWPNSTLTIEDHLPLITSTNNQGVLSNLTALTYPSPSTDITGSLNKWSGLRMISTESPSSPKNGLVLSSDTFTSSWPNSIGTIKDSNSLTSSIFDFSKITTTSIDENLSTDLTRRHFTISDSTGWLLTNPSTGQFDWKSIQTLTPGVMGDQSLKTLLTTPTTTKKISNYGPIVAIQILKPTATNGRFRSAITLCEGAKASYRFGETTAIDKLFDSMNGSSSTFTLSTIKRLITVEIDDRQGSQVVGPPIDVIALTKKGSVWIQVKQECR